MATPITITISGHAASGKTTIAQLVADILREAGFGVHVDDFDLNVQSNPPHFDERLAALVERDTLIDVVTVQTQK
jgi:uridine kinase